MGGVKGIGEIKLILSDSTIKTFIEVRYVPKLKRNLISLGALDSVGFSIKLDKGFLKVIKETLVVLQDVRENGLYFL